MRWLSRLDTNVRKNNAFIDELMMCCWITSLFLKWSYFGSVVGVVYGNYVEILWFFSNKVSQEKLGIEYKNTWFGTVWYDNHIYNKTPTRLFTTSPDSHLPELLHQWPYVGTIKINDFIEPTSHKIKINNFMTVFCSMWIFILQKKTKKKVS